MIQSRRPRTRTTRIRSKWQRASSPPVLMTIPEDEDATTTNKSSFYNNEPDEARNTQQQEDEFLDMAVWVARERAARGLPPYKRTPELDAMARQHATRMAAQRSVVHSVATVQDLQRKLQAPDVGENITRGDSVYRMHQETMQANCSGHQPQGSSSNINRANILSPHFDELGSAMAFGSDGKIYCCQVFRKQQLRAAMVVQ